MEYYLAQTRNLDAAQNIAPANQEYSVAHQEEKTFSRQFVRETGNALVLSTCLGGI